MSPTPPGNVSTSGAFVHVGIIGAGFAGLRCADILLKSACKVTILEARDRIGGRVAQSEHLGHLVDLGPNWIHGTKDNCIYELAKQTGSRLHAWNEEQAVFDPTGELLDPQEASEYARLLWDDGLVADAFKYSEEHGDSIDSQRSLYEFFQQNSKAFFEEQAESEARKKRETLLLTADAWGAYIGSSVKQQSLKFFWLEECLEGENPFLADTYQKILQQVAKPALDGADIKYGHEVTNISSPNNPREEGHQVSISCTNGVEASFDAVVITSPLGWLKQHQSAFEPPLPHKLSSAINNIGYGSLDKVYITFPSAFWDEPLPAQPALANGLDPKGITPNVKATSMPVHQSALQQEGKHYPSVSMFLSPAYAPDTNPNRWYQDCMNLSALPEDCAHPTLLFYIYGDCSRHIASLVTSAETEAEGDAKVLDFFQPYYSRLPNYDAAEPACTPQAVLATAWASDKFAGYGSYSNFPIGLEQADRDIETMRYGMPERGIYLAGEHTAPFEATGTTTGAYMSGEKVAERIVLDLHVKRAK